MSGYRISDEVLNIYKDMVEKELYKALYFKIIDNQVISKDKCLPPNSSFEEFLKNLNENECIYAVYMDKNNKVQFILFVPSIEDNKQRSLYIALSSLLKKKLNIGKEQFKHITSKQQLIDF